LHAPAIIKARSAHSGRIARWYGEQHLNDISRAMKGWPGDGILLACPPRRTKILAAKDGDFIGDVGGGRFASALDYLDDLSKRVAKAQRLKMNAGFGSLAELLSEAENMRRRRQFVFATNFQSNTGIWNAPLGGFPAAAAAPGGSAWTDASGGVFQAFTNPESGDTQHLFRSSLQNGSTGVCRTILMIDTLFGVTKTMNSTATEAVTGVPTRYQGSTPNQDDYSVNNFCFPYFRQGPSSGVSHNVTVCQYTDQDGNPQSFQSVAGLNQTSQCPFDIATGQWFLPLAAGSRGVKALTQMQVDQLIATGNIDFVIAHPLAWLFAPMGRLLQLIENVNSVLQLTRIFDDAAIAFISVNYENSTSVGHRIHWESVAS